MSQDTAIAVAEPPQEPARTPQKPIAGAWVFLILAATWLLIYVPAMFQPGLLDDADSVHAEASKEILLRHDWVTLYVDGVRYLEKSPLMYWAVAASFKVFGVGEWQARLPLALGIAALMFVSYLFARRVFGNQGGLYAGLIAATAPGFYVFTRFLIPDVLVAMWLTATLYFFFIAMEQIRARGEASRWVCWGMAATCALNVLTKSLIGIVFPAIIILVYLFVTGELRKIAKLRILSGALVFLAIAAPWHILASIRNPGSASSLGKGFAWFYFINEQFLRYLGKRVPYDYDKVPLLLFWAFLLLWLIPWAAFAFSAMKEIPIPWRQRIQDLDERGRANLLFGVWALLILLFFSFSSRQEYYNLPAVPALALPIAGWLECESKSELRSRERRAARIASSVMLGIGAVTFVLTMAIIVSTKPFPSGTDIGDVLTHHEGHYKLSLGHMQDLTLESLGLFRTPIWEIGVSVLAGTALNWAFRKRGQALAANLALAGMMVAVLGCVHEGYVIFSPELSSKKLALEIAKEYQPGQTIVINRDYEWGSTLNFYTGIPVHMLNGRRADMWFGSFFYDAPHVFESDQSLAQMWSGPQRVYLFSQQSLAELALKDLDPRTVHVFAKSGGKIIFTNQASGGR
jgi:4-amino-4-deoxy-L-arabinose transferase-like glycosyltransferase